MGNYYDPWMHRALLLRNRVVQYILLSLLLGALVWLELLHVVYEIPPWLPWWEATKVAVLEPHTTSRVLLCLCMTIGALLAAWLFTWAIMRGHLRAGDRLHRGARFIQPDDER